MKQRRSRKRENNENDNEENLRGKLREQQKTIKTLLRRIRQLEKQLLLSPSHEEDAEDVSPAPKKEPEKFCNHCKSFNVQKVKVTNRGGELVLWICQDCKHREKI